MSTARERNFWGWGWADRFPDRDGRAALGSALESMLGFSAHPPQDPPDPANITLRAPRVDVPSALRDFCTDERRARIEHTYGKNFRDIVRGFAGDFSSAPDLVARVRTEDDVAALLAHCTRERIAVVPFGGGTSVVSGVECDPSVAARYAGVISLDTRGLDRVLEFDAVSHAARIQAGATGPGLEAQLLPHGVTLRHFPQSFEFSTLGGWIATRAGGHYATLYTHIDDRVESVRMITPTGVYESRRLPGSGAGPSPDRLVIGSEGVLGVITEAWVRVHPRPTQRASASVHFESFAQGAEACRAIAQSGLYPTNCRLIDADESRLNAVADDGHHVLLLGFESADHALEPWIERALAICREKGASCVKGPVLHSGEREKESGSWREAFINVPYLQTALASMGMVADTFETACTWDRFAALHRAVTESVTAAMNEACGAGRLTCRFTHVYPDGPAPYYTFVAPGRLGEQLAQWEKIKRAAGDALIANGATITHHHAVGRLHRPWYDRQRPDAFARALRAAKRELDPGWVLNPGVLVDEV